MNNFWIIEVDRFTVINGRRDHLGKGGGDVKLAGASQITKHHKMQQDETKQIWMKWVDRGWSFFFLCLGWYKVDLVSRHRFYECNLVKEFWGKLCTLFCVQNNNFANIFFFKDSQINKKVKTLGFSIAMWIIHTSYYSKYYDNDNLYFDSKMEDFI